MPKFPTGTSVTKALTDFNNATANLNIGNVPPRMTQTEIENAITADTDILAYNTTSDQLEFWHGLDDRRIIA